MRGYGKVIERDEASMTTRVDGIQVTDEEVGRMTKPTSEQMKVRDEIAARIHESLSESSAIHRLEEPGDQVGPRGGHSSRVKLWVEKDGDLYPVVISVYCDENIERSLVADIEAERAKVEKQAQLRALVLGEEPEPGDE